MNELTERLQTVIDTKKINQSQLARALGSNHQTISRWLKGKPAPSRGSCLRIYTALGCNFDCLWEGKGEMFPYTPPQGDQLHFNFGSKSPSQIPEAEVPKSLSNTELIKMTADILESETVHKSALSSVVKALHEAVQMQNEMREVKEELGKMANRMENMEQLLLSLGAKAPEKRNKIANS